MIPSHTLTHLSSFNVGYPTWFFCSVYLVERKLGWDFVELHLANRIPQENMAGIPIPPCYILFIDVSEFWNPFVVGVWKNHVYGLSRAGNSIMVLMFSGRAKLTNFLGGKRWVRGGHRFSSGHKTTNFGLLGLPDEVSGVAFLPRILFEVLVKVNNTNSGKRKSRVSSTKVWEIRTRLVVCFVSVE